MSRTLVRWLARIPLLGRIAPRFVPKPAPYEYILPEFKHGGVELYDIPVRVEPLWNARSGEWRMEHFTKPNPREPVGPTNPKYVITRDGGLGRITHLESEPWALSAADYQIYPKGPVQ